MSSIQADSPLDDTNMHDSSTPADPLESDGSLAQALGGFLRGFVHTLPKLVNRKWWWVTLLVIAGMVFLMRLGFWQLDRLEERRAFNALVAERWMQAPFDLQHEALPADLESMGYRRVEVNGAFDYDEQIVLTNQSGANGEAGVQLITPFVLDDGRAVLVSRGWVPQYLAEPENWDNLQEESNGTVVGLIQRSQELEGATFVEGGQVEWYNVNIPLIQRQMPYELLSVFLLQLPEEGRGWEDYPYRSEPIALDEGSHFSYAIQWFMFGLIFGFGYIQFVRWQEERNARIKAMADAGLFDEDSQEAGQN